MPGNTPSETSPVIGNLRVGRGFLSMQLAGENSYQDMGETMSMKIKVSPTLLDYFSSRDGVQKKKLTVATRLDASISMVLNEATGRNMGLGLLATANASGNIELDIMSNPLIYCSLKFTDTSAAGPQWQVTLPNVLITPEDALEMIAEGSGDWMKIPLTGNVQYDAASAGFGRFVSYNLV